MTADPRLRVLVVPGTTPGRWLRTWAERVPDVPAELVHVATADQLDALRDGRADIGLVRLRERPDGMSAIRLYEEATVVVVPRGHVVTAADDVTAADLADETLLVPADDVLGWADAPGEPSLLSPLTTEEAVGLVASGVGVLLVPQSLARLHHRTDVTYRPVVDAPTSAVALAWPTERTTPAVETFVGIVRGRTANSSRGAGAAQQGAEKPDGSSRERSGDSRDRRSRGGAGPDARGRGGQRRAGPGGHGRPAGGRGRGRR